MKLYNVSGVGRLRSIGIHTYMKSLFRVITSRLLYYIDVIVLNI